MLILRVIFQILMKSNYKIGIVGLGYVGSAIKSFFEKEIQIFSYDIQKKKSTEKSIKDLLGKKVDFLFLCLPTPMNEDGSTFLGHINKVLEEISSYGFNGVIVIKSTIPPKTTENYSNKYKALQIVFNPEFLTEANFIEDFKNQEYIVLGGGKDSCGKVKNLYSNYFSSKMIHCVSSTESEMLKYYLNSYLALKVSFSNEIYQLCKSMDINYDKLIYLSKLDKRIGKTHMNVPGPDGFLGFGGSCFPKDIRSFLRIFEDEKVQSLILKAAWQRNREIDRPEQDWLKLKGRSVV